VQITVAGEALIDLIIAPNGAVSAHPGGAPFNVSRAVARLAGDCQFLGRTGDDAFGRRLRSTLEESGVTLLVPDPTRDPTTIAVAEVDAAGVAEYHFYLEGTSAGEVRPTDVSTDALADSSAIALGGLGLLMEPMAGTLKALLAGVDPAVMVLLDPNCRPQAIPPGTSFASVVAPFLDRADVIKVSTDDLRLIAPNVDPSATARHMLTLNPAAVLITDGPGSVSVVTAEGSQDVPVPAVDVVDTVGAGDAFVAGFLTWWVQEGGGREDLADPQRLIDATRAAVRVAAAACTVAGAELPPDFSWS
jgi:fructokinase